MLNLPEFGFTFPGITGTESYHTALGARTWSHEDLGDDDTLRNQSDQLSIDSFEVRL